jgi:hypothetical protein
LVSHVTFQLYYILPVHFTFCYWKRKY